LSLLLALPVSHGAIPASKPGHTVHGPLGHMALDSGPYSRVYLAGGVFCAKVKEFLSQSKEVLT